MAAMASNETRLSTPPVGLLGETMTSIFVTFVLLGVFRLFWKSKEVVCLPTGSVTKERSVFFDLKYLGKLTDMIENEQLNGETEIKSSGSGNVRMDVMISQDNKFAAVQLYQFVPYTYTPVTSVRYYTGSDAVAVSTFLEKCKTA